MHLRDRLLIHLGLAQSRRESALEKRFGRIVHLEINALRDTGHIDISRLEPRFWHLTVRGRNAARQAWLEEKQPVRTAC